MDVKIPAPKKPAKDFPFLISRLLGNNLPIKQAKASPVVQHATPKTTNVLEPVIKLARDTAAYKLKIAGHFSVSSFLKKPFQFLLTHCLTLGHHNLIMFKIAKNPAQTP